MSQAKQTLAVERRIITRLVADAIAAGFTLDVQDGEEVTLKNSTDRIAILSAMFTTDEDVLFYRRDGKSAGWVRLIHGNGTAVISDYTTNLGTVVTPAEQLADRIDNGEEPTPTVIARFAIGADTCADGIGAVIITAAEDGFTVRIDGGMLPKGEEERHFSASRAAPLSDAYSFALSRVAAAIGVQLGIEIELNAEATL